MDPRSPNNLVDVHALAGFRRNRLQSESPCHMVSLPIVDVIFDTLPVLLFKRQTTNGQRVGWSSVSYSIRAMWHTR